MIGIIQADARSIPLADATVQCVVTSPPYWGLRKYAGAQDLIWHPSKEPWAICAAVDHDWKSNGRTAHHPDRGSVGKDANGSGLIGGARDQAAKKARGESAPLGDTYSLCGAWRGGFGLEPTIEMYIAHTVEILKEIRRVLRPDGVVFWNIGDSYASGKGTCHNPGGGRNSLSGHEALKDGQAYPLNRGNKSDLDAQGLKPKDLCLIPERVAIAAQADGWWVRSMIIWAKPNPMPESCTDRPTDAYEHIVMLTKSAHYFWDADAVREPITESSAKRIAQGNFQNQKGGPKDYGITGVNPNRSARKALENFADNCSGVRNLRNVWMLATQPYNFKGANDKGHFATFPEEIPRRCILAATSERGACQQCGTPWQRVTEDSKTSGKSWNGNDLKSQGVNRGEQPEYAGESLYENYQPKKTIGWKPGCKCFAAEVRDTSPCLVLDPFGGSGTTARVAVELNRRAVSLDLAYHDHAQKRTRNVQRNLIGV